MKGFEHLTVTSKYDRCDEYQDTSFYPLLKKLPKELVEHHMDKIEEIGLSESDTHEYLQNILTERETATTESFISDAEILAFCKAPKEEIFERLEKEVFMSPDIGFGTTAKVKRFDLKLNDAEVFMAIKYVVTPNEKTLSASAEHKMLIEVERIQNIEKIEEDADLQHIKVPHPYFHHKNQNLQCYGMELVRGVNLQQVFDEDMDPATKEELWEAFKNVDQQELLREITIFFNRMHNYCLHGDIKPRNIMIDARGKVYVIDFGQSILTTSVSDEQADQFENLKEDEIKITETIIRMAYKRLKPAA